MPFVEIETITKANTPPTAKVSYLRGLHKDAKSTDGKKPKLMVTIPTTLIGTSKSKAWALLVGTGADAGKILIRGDKAPGVTKAIVIPGEHAHFFRFNFGFVPAFGTEIFDEGACEVRKIDDEQFEITTPSVVITDAPAPPKNGARR